MFIKIPVFWAPDNYEDLETCKLDVKFTQDDLIINTDQICGYHANDSGETMVRMANGDIFRSPIEFKQFQKEFPCLVARLELVINTDSNVQ